MSHWPESYNRKREFRKELLAKIARFSYTRHRFVLVAVLLSFLLSLALASRLTIKSDILDLLPAENQEVRTFRQALQDFGSMDYLLVAIESSNGGSADEFEDFADSFAQHLRSSPMIEYVEYRIWEEGEALGPLLESGLLYLSPGEVDALGERLSDQRIREQVERIKALMLTPTALPMKGLIEKDPFNLLPLLKERLLKRGGGMRLYPFDGYYLSEDRSMLLVIARPVKPAQDLVFARKLLQMAEGAEAQARREVELAKGKSLERMKVSYGGGYLIALHDSQTIQRDIMRNFLTSLIGVLLLFLYSFRTAKSLLFASLPLLVGVSWTLAFAALTVGELNYATSGFSALLIGLAIDLVIVLYNRYLEERSSGREGLASIVLMLSETGQSVFIGAVTTAAAFYAMMVTRFRGLSELGLLTGSGILFCLLSTYLLLPALSRWDEERSRVAVSPPMRSFLLPSLLPPLFRHYRWIAICSLLLLLTLGAFASSLEFDEDLNNIRPRHNPALQLQEKIAEKFGLSYHHFLVLVEAGEMEEALVANEQVASYLRSWVGREGITGLDSLEALLPSRTSQEKRLAHIRSLQAKELNGERIVRTFRAALEQSGLRPSFYDDYLRRFQRFLTPSRPIGWEEVKKSSLGKVLDRYLRIEKGKVKVATYVYQDRESWRKGPPAELAQGLSGLGSVRITGVNVLAGELKREIYHDARISALLALLAVAALLYLDFGSLRNTLLALLPLGFGIVCMFGLMELLGMKLNLMNIFAVIMILGIGVDYGVHMLHRYREGQAGDVELAFRQVGKAILMAALTTILGFGTISLSDYPGLVSLGVASILGTGACAVGSLIVLPALLILGKERAKNLPPPLRDSRV